MIDEVWTLHRRDDDLLLAELSVTDQDFPWLYARVEPRGGLDDLRPLFAEELRLLEQVEAWEAAYDAISAAVTLRYPDGQVVPEFLLHLEGDEAWWRWIDDRAHE
ncbi:hypothetical protein M1L60_09160 [Actinoplanes sp. TRM 88003]|uniref:Uncharacterized protein n=1 Tax=Paractinoplanes aksuensis TaxID=2939490 RepID=A0ABT1DIV5_9ACTN|nr:hypothetical protein [Actinoplanes aksuensis]MCO8270762.1 hypothetical protein [Actinoplanes aksuensis]